MRYLENQEPWDLEHASVTAVEEILGVYKKHNCRVWLTTGALIGLVRENRLLKWDTDIDLFSLKEEISFEQMMTITDELMEKGYEVCRFWDKQMISLRREGILHINLHFLENDAPGSEYAYFTQYETPTKIGQVLSFMWWSITAARHGISKKSSNIIDIFTTVVCRHGHDLQDPKIPRTPVKMFFSSTVGLCWLIPFKQKVCNIIWERSKKYNKIALWRFPKSHFTELTDYPFYHTTIPIPANYKEHLEYYCGPDWMVPRNDKVYGDMEENKTWNEVTDNPTVVSGISYYHLPGVKEG